ncbi:MAG: thioredoxin-disulfide reductase [Myxococcaceae bacterium]
MADRTQVCIIGSGPAGYTAAVYAARANLSPVVFAGAPAIHDPQRVPGGQLMTTTDVENYPGFPDAVSGPELMERFQKQAERFGTKVLMENVVELRLMAGRPFLVKGEQTSLEANTVILATGATAKWLNVPGEADFKNRGVSACATCDGAFFKNQDVLVVGGGDTAMEEASYLSKIVRSVTLIHRRDSLRASKIMQERVLKNPKIRVLWNSAVDEVLGDAKGMNAARVRNLKNGEVNTVAAHGLFVAIGHRPNNELFAKQLELLENGYLRVAPGTARTSITGVFGAGDVADPTYRQAVTAAGTGCMAAIEAERFIVEQGD